MFAIYWYLKNKEKLTLSTNSISVVHKDIETVCKTNLNVTMPILVTGLDHALVNKFYLLKSEFCIDTRNKNLTLF